MAERVVVIVGALVAVALQLFVAPYVGIVAASPNFLIAYAMALAVVRPADYGCVLPFVLGLFFDSVGGGPLGAMAFCLTAFSVVAARLFLSVGNDSHFMACAVMAAGVLVVELAYGAFVLVMGYDAALPQALLLRVLPCFACDLIAALIAYPILGRFARPAGVVRTELTQLR